MNTDYAFILSSIAGLSTIIGAFVIFLGKKKTLNFLIGGISFAAGVMFFLSLFDLFPESLVFLNNTFNFKVSILISIIFICTGVCLSIIIDKLFPSTFNEDNLYKLGLITMIGIMIHNIPEGISVALPIFYHTKSKKKAFLYTIICAVSEPLGALIAYLFLKPTYLTLGIIYASITGIMIYISMYELFPSVIKYKRYRITYTFYILGLILVLINHFLF